MDIDSLVHASESCPRLFLDGGSNTGEHVEAFLKGSFHRCALSSPNRLYGRAWKNASTSQRKRWMQPLAEPSTFCVRSFDAAPGFAQRLQSSRPIKPGVPSVSAWPSNVRFVDAALGTVTGPALPRTIIKYSNDTWGLTSTTFSHRDIHAGRPPLLEEFVTHGPGVDVRQLVRRYRSSSPTIALKLDIEGGEFGVLDALADAPDVLCSISYLFVEYHNLKFNLTKYGFRGDAYHHIGDRIHHAMDSVPDCKLRSECHDSRSFPLVPSPKS